MREKEVEERLRKLFDKRNKAGIGGIEEEPKTPEKPKTPIGSSDVPTATTGGATAPPQVEIIRNADTGKASGIRLPDGREFLGIGEDEIRGLASKFGGDLGAPIIEASEAGRLRTEQEAAEERLGMLEEREKNKEEPITQTPTEETGVQGVDSQGNIIGTVTPITANFPTKTISRLNQNTGEVKTYQVEDYRAAFKIKDGYSLKGDGTFVDDKGLTVTKADAVEFKDTEKDEWVATYMQENPVVTKTDAETAFPKAKPAWLTKKVDAFLAVEK